MACPTLRLCSGCDHRNPQRQVPRGRRVRRHPAPPAASRGHPRALAGSEVLDRADIVLDVGGVYDPEHRRFDHHQTTSGARENGILYSAFGLLWQHYGLEFCGGDEEVWRRIDRGLVQAIDAVDNGQDLYTLTDFHARPIDVSEVLGWFNPVSLVGDEEFDAQFERASAVAAQLLQRLLLKTRDAVEGSGTSSTRTRTRQIPATSCSTASCPTGASRAASPGCCSSSSPTRTATGRSRPCRRTRRASSPGRCCPRPGAAPITTHSSRPPGRRRGVHAQGRFHRRGAQPRGRPADAAARPGRPGRGRRRPARPPAARPAGDAPAGRAEPSAQAAPAAPADPAAD